MASGKQDIQTRSVVHPPILTGEELTKAVMRSLKMAAKDAHLKAYLTGTAVIVRQNGKTVALPPDPAMYEDLIPPPFQPNQTT